MRGRGWNVEQDVSVCNRTFVYRKFPQIEYRFDGNGFRDKERL